MPCRRPARQPSHVALNGTSERSRHPSAKPIVRRCTVQSMTSGAEPMIKKARNVGAPRCRGRASRVDGRASRPTSAEDAVRSRFNVGIQLTGHY
eukprot:scaffold26919_cov33-Tisochrysis_lutea.AAC.1